MHLQRNPFLCSLEMRGAFRYRDLFQFLPASTDDPRPPPGSVGAGWGLTVEVHMDERPCPDREVDTWAHDVRERHRYDSLRRKVKKSAGPHWWETEKQIRKMHRPPAIVREIVNLLSTLTQHSFTEPEQGNVWVLDRNSKSPIARHMQLWFPSFGSGPPDKLTTYPGGSIVSLPAKDYWAGDSLEPREQVEFPDDIEELLDIYFGLPETLRVVFARTCELGRVAREVWPTSRSISLVAAVFAIDGLAHAGEPPPPLCRVCSQMTSEQKCESCGAPRFGLTARFRQFVESYVDVGGLRKGFARDLFILRSAIGHRAELLRDDEYDSGFTAGESDSQWDYRDVAFTLTRKALRGWLSAQVARPPA